MNQAAELTKTAEDFRAAVKRFDVRARCDRQSEVARLTLICDDVTRSKLSRTFAARLIQRLS